MVYEIPIDQRDADLIASNEKDFFVNEYYKDIKIGDCIYFKCKDCDHLLNKWSCNNDTHVTNKDYHIRPMYIVTFVLYMEEAKYSIVGFKKWDRESVTLEELHAISEYLNGINKEQSKPNIRLWGMFKQRTYQPDYYKIGFSNSKGDEIRLLKGLEMIFKSIKEPLEIVLDKKSNLTLTNLLEKVGYQL